VPRTRNSGTAAVEFALLCPFMLILLTGVAEIGIAGYQAMQVQAAVEAGALYAANNGATTFSATNVVAAVTNATGTAGLTATPAPTAFCGCPTATGIVSQTTNCTSVCAGSGLSPGHYVTVNAAIPHQTLMPFLNLPIPATLTATSTIRVQ
jgi:Flp pilus assembly protein TadG